MMRAVYPSSVRHPSVDIGFSDTDKWINANFWGKVPILHISRQLFFVFQFFFTIVFFVFTNIWDHMGEQISNIFSKSTQQIHSQILMHTPRECLCQCCSKNCEFQILDFCQFFFSFPLMWDHMGVKFQMTSLKVHIRQSPKFMHTPREGLFQIY